MRTTRSMGRGPDAAVSCTRSCSSFVLLVSAAKPAWRKSFAPAAASDHVSSRPKRGASDLRRREAGGDPRADAAAARDELADRLRRSPVSTGSSSPVPASPSTNGSRMKLVTSSRAIVRAALNVASDEHDEVERRVLVARVAAERAREQRRRAASPPANVPMIAGVRRRGAVLGLAVAIHRVPCVSVAELKTSADYVPTGDQPTAIATLAEGLEAGERYQTLIGATGTGKTATMAWTIEKVGRPALVIAHNKTLAAQLCNEFREFFPHNAVEYFVSYYDYYQPEAYVPQADLYIEKDSSRNDDIDRLRHSATLEPPHAPRRDHRRVGVVHLRPRLAGRVQGAASSSSSVGEEQDRDLMLRKLIDIQYVRNDTLLGRGRFRVKGDVVEVQPAYSETAYRISFFGDEVEAITHFDPLTGEVLSKLRPDHDLPGDAVRHVEADDRARRRRDPARARTSRSSSSRPRGRCSRRTGSGSAPSTTSR